MSKDPNKDPMAILRQWMDNVTEMLERVPYITLSESDRHKFKVLRAIAAQISPVSATLDVPWNYRCNACRREFDEAHSALVDPHKSEFISVCPHCRSNSFADLIVPPPPTVCECRKCGHKFGKPITLGMLNGQATREACPSCRSSEFAESTK